jgi:hypothetical protein
MSKNNFTGSLSIQSTDELCVLVELMWETKGFDRFDVRSARLRKEVTMLWEDWAEKHTINHRERTR